MTLNAFKCNYLTPLHFKGLTEHFSQLLQICYSSELFIALLLKAHDATTSQPKRLVPYRSGFLKEEYPPLR